MKVFVRDYERKKPAKMKVDITQGTKRVFTDSEIEQMKKIPEGVKSTFTLSEMKVDVERKKDGLKYKTYFDGGEIEGYLTFKELEEAKE